MFLSNCLNPKSLYIIPYLDACENKLIPPSLAITTDADNPFSLTTLFKSATLVSILFKALLASSCLSNKFPRSVTTAENESI